MENAHPNEEKLVEIGAAVPDFVLRNSDGTVYSLGEETAVRPVVVVFYRGDW